MQLCIGQMPASALLITLSWIDDLIFIRIIRTIRDKVINMAIENLFTDRSLTRAEALVRQMVKSGLKIAVVIPCYNVQEHVKAVIQSIPGYVRVVVLVNDASHDQTSAIIDKLAQEGNGRVFVLHLPRNIGVGGAALAGLHKASELGADISIKMDGDGQMDPRYIPLLLEPLITGKADYTKGNRFRSVLTLAQMPLVRRLGNAMLSLLTKFASGYWNIFDPTNGYIAIRREVFEMLPPKMIHPRYFFESSLLIALGILGAVVLDIPMQARYGTEKSMLRISQVVFEFPLQLALGFLRRLWFKKILYSLTMEAILGISGFVFFCLGFIFGLVQFMHYAINLKVAAPSGTVMTAALPVLLGFQMMMNAILLDIQSVPSMPLSEKLYT
jgi:glycosyltransferase involved in cell wall biosynthesis